MDNNRVKPEDIGRARSIVVWAYEEATTARKTLSPSSDLVEALVDEDMRQTRGTMTREQSRETRDADLLPAARARVGEHLLATARAGITSHRAAVDRVQAAVAEMSARSRRLEMPSTRLTEGEKLRASSTDYDLLEQTKGLRQELAHTRIETRLNRLKPEELFRAMQNAEQRGELLDAAIAEELIARKLEAGEGPRPHTAEYNHFINRLQTHQDGRLSASDREYLAALEADVAVLQRGLTEANTLFAGIEDQKRVLVLDDEPIVA